MPALRITRAARMQAEVREDALSRNELLLWRLLEIDMEYQVKRLERKLAAARAELAKRQQERSGQSICQDSN